MKRLYLELCREEQRLVKEMIKGTVLPDADAPIQVRLDAIGDEIEKIKSQTNHQTIQEWLEEL